jgi:DNA-binding GntR family transcriptional regulator
MVVQSNPSPTSGYAAEHAYRVIREQILSGQLTAGQWLREGELAEVIGVSRTPVREALRRLTSEGLVSHEHNRGVQVHRWSSKDLDDIFSLRSVLEPLGAAQAAQRGHADLSYLTAITDDMEQQIISDKPELAVITELNNLFHKAVLNASGNELLCSVVGSIIQTPLVRRTFSSYQPDSLRRSISQHRDLISALRAQDMTWAEATMRAHVHAGWDEVRQKR